MSRSSDREFRQAKLDKLMEIEGYEGLDGLNALFEACITDSVCPAICCNPDNPECNYTEEQEPDATRGWCPECRRNTMKSALVLGGLV